MNIDLINELVALARQSTSTQQGVTNEDYLMWSTDDVFNAGFDDGKIVLARDLLDKMCIVWQDNYDAVADL